MADPVSFCPVRSGPLQPRRELLEGEGTAVALRLLLSGPPAPVVELRVRDPPGLDPSEAPLVLLAVGLEHRGVGLLLRPLLESPTARQNAKNCWRI